MRARQRGQKIYYYLDTGGKPRVEIPLGTDYIEAVKKWGDLTSARKPADAAPTFVDLERSYRKMVLPGKAPRTQKDNEAELVWLMRFFGDPPAPLNGIEPMHIKQYMTWRVTESRSDAVAKNNERVKEGRTAIPVPQKIGQTRANREVSLFSHMWNHAREEGLTAQPNPCAGIHKFKEAGRDVVISSDLQQKLMTHAGKPLQFAVRLARATGQRPGDVIRMSESHIAGDVLNVSQGKTKAKLRIEIAGELASVLADIKEYKAQFKVRSLQLLVAENGQPMTRHMLRDRFDDARAAAGIPKAEFKFMDLRPSAATSMDDESGIKAAQALLGHTTEAMTSHYIRHKIGKKVKAAN